MSSVLDELNLHWVPLAASSVITIVWSQRTNFVLEEIPATDINVKNQLHKVRMIVSPFL